MRRPRGGRELAMRGGGGWGVLEPFESPRGRTVPCTELSDHLGDLPATRTDAARRASRIFYSCTAAASMRSRSHRAALRDLSSTDP